MLYRLEEHYSKQMKMLCNSADMPNGIRRPVGLFNLKKKKKINPHDNSAVSRQVLHVLRLIPSPVSVLGFSLTPEVTGWECSAEPQLTQS